MLAIQRRDAAMTAPVQLDAPDIQDVVRSRTLGLAYVGTVLVVAHNAQPPAPDDWARYCELIARHQGTATGQLVLAEGPGPNATQRQQALNQVPKDYVIPPTAVFTESPLVRGVVTLFNWFTPRAMRAFVPGDVPGAARHLGLSEEQVQRLVDIGKTVRPALQ
ncbi:MULTISPECIES: STAS/SEC14 domain-containing protein [Myxococcus]|nr:MULTISPECIES: STAS/SEC14 domain-containing protein [Myxococcus]WAM25421.1 STAS/SEC14 domain-containing protein [Myxococcus sp. NMCA1]